MRRAQPSQAAAEARLPLAIVEAADVNKSSTPARYQAWKSTTTKGTKQMTILCPAEFQEAVQFAVKTDQLFEAHLRHDKGLDEQKRGQAVRTLLQCFGWRANSDAIDNREKLFRAGTEVVDANGIMRVITDVEHDSLPMRETFIMADIAPYSFFFREEWIDPHTRQQVTVYDRVWTIFKDGSTHEQVDNMTIEEVDKLLWERQGVSRTFDREEAEKAAAVKAVVREDLRRRVGMCGGIIFHEEYTSDGKKAGYGSWSTHT